VTHAAENDALARAWDEGYEAGYDLAKWEDRGGGERPDYPNPYRVIPPGETAP
jgi:hypothetical protein